MFFTNTVQNADGVEKVENIHKHRRDRHLTEFLARLIRAGPG